MKNFILILAFIIAIISSLVNVFSFHFSILVGTFIDFLIFIPLHLLGFVLAALSIASNKSKKIIPYIPLFILSISIILNSFLNSGIWLHYFMNKNNLETIIKECNEQNIYEFTDMLRYSKNINDFGFGDTLNLDTKEKFFEKFDYYINKNNSDKNKVYEILQKIREVGAFSIYVKDGYNVFIIDGILDNTYGYIKSTNYKISVNDIIPPYYDKVVRLIELDSGWYFFYTT